jgi:hypothetical protein
VNQRSVSDSAEVEANKRLAVRWLELVSAGDVDELCRMTDASWTMVGVRRTFPPVPTASEPCSPRSARSPRPGRSTM